MFLAVEICEPVSKPLRVALGVFFEKADCVGSPIG